MSHAVTLINDGKLHSFTPVEGAEVHYRRIRPIRYQNILRECRAEDRGAHVDKKKVEILVKEILDKDGKLKNLDAPKVSSRIYGLLLVSEDLGKIDWNAVHVRVLQWAIADWSGIGFSEDEGEAPVTSENVQAFAESQYGAELFKLVLQDVSAQSKAGDSASADPLARSGSTSNSHLTTAGTSARSASTTTPKTKGSRRASSQTKKPAKSAASASTRKSRPLH